MERQSTPADVIQAEILERQATPADVIQAEILERQSATLRAQARSIDNALLAQSGHITEAIQRLVAVLDGMEQTARFLETLAAVARAHGRCPHCRAYHPVPEVRRESFLEGIFGNFDAREDAPGGEVMREQHDEWVETWRSKFDG